VGQDIISHQNLHGDSSVPSVQCTDYTVRHLAISVEGPNGTIRDANSEVQADVPWDFSIWHFIKSNQKSLQNKTPFFCTLYSFSL